MRRIIIGAALAAVCLASTQCVAADFSAKYQVEGTSPGGGSPYSGTVAITQTGEATYEVVWVIGSQKFVGTGIGGTEGLAVAYRSGNDTGIAIYREGKGGQIDGYWTYAGGKQVGRETWRPQ